LSARNGQIQCDGLVITQYGLIESSQFFERIAQNKMERGVVRLTGNGLTDSIDCLLMVAFLRMDNSQQEERIGMIGVYFYDFFIR